MRATFTDLGIPFPLFEAPVTEAAQYIGIGTCSICRRSERHCFRLGAGGYVIVRCGQCGAKNGLHTASPVSQSCRVCTHSVAFPALAGDPPATCYDCLREDRAALTQDTILGMVSWAEAITGVTFGEPGLDTPEYELVPAWDDWIAARVSPTYLLELVHTPAYSSLHGERWEFHCKQPMVYLGEWDRADFCAHAAGGDGRSLFERIVQHIDDFMTDRFWIHGDSSGQCVYVFRCPACGIHTANWEID